MSKRAADDGLAGVAPEGSKPRGPVQLCPQMPGLNDSKSEALHGSWASEKGKCTIGKDPVTARLCYMEDLQDGERLHGWLDMVDEATLLWQGSLALLKSGQRPWYGPSFGEAPEIVGDIRVKLLPGAEGSGPKMESQIRMAEEGATWEEPTTFSLEAGVEVTLSKPNLDNIILNTPEEPEREEGDRKKVRT
mmetsp:Transcript_11516/g.26704  ORF Transcript_11516/g.26704 Transcript_11516/m.26704 type:complete len:191 (-) Transcript_11516:63-635(-)|eukprot:CAMPEP_0178419758 /NCGR_PEP_ID=MMETSP0689_2-20121128/25776_1 /TAXON_ID=160604 /ORGANISM="Amphidinium massartii, Strain CS-259" /LENGTH=190 /DNA_ID=CAMNT_0020041207 /DNA_START=18 /DNA_END=590 /DNA_ORIENTATION=+